MLLCIDEMTKVIELDVDINITWAEISCRALAARTSAMLPAMLFASPATHSEIRDACERRYAYIRFQAPRFIVMVIRE